jgi:outer membrane receptor protein involved in Fe transport
MFRRFACATSALALCSAASGAALAQTAPGGIQVDDVVVTATRTPLPRSALPATLEQIERAGVEQQSALGASAVETVAALIPSFSPTRQKLSGLIDAIGVWHSGFGDVSVGLPNLLGEQYVTYYSDVQRPGDDLSYYAGRGRTVTLGLTRRF